MDVGETGAGCSMGKLLHCVNNLHPFFLPANYSFNVPANAMWCIQSIVSNVLYHFEDAL